MLHPETCDYLRKVLNEVIYARRDAKPIELNVLEGYISKVKFRKYRW